MQEVNIHHSSLATYPMSAAIGVPLHASGEGGAVVADSVQTHQEGASEAEAEEPQAGQSRNRYRHQQAEADTIPPDPREMKPFATGTPLTMKPEMLEGNYWKDGLVHLQKGPHTLSSSCMKGPFCRCTNPSFQ